MTAALDRLLGDEDGTLSGVRRMAEGASKEQFVCEYDGPRGAERLVLRMDPLEGLIETCRRREDQILRAMDGTVAVPKVRYADTVGSYQVSLSSPMRPFSEANGHDAPGLIDETLPGEGAMIEDVVVGFEDSVRQPVVAHELPDILNRVELWAFQRQRQQGVMVLRFRGHGFMRPVRG